MKFMWRSLLILLCGGLMALAALAGQVGYGDNYGRVGAGLCGADADACRPAG